MSGLSETLRALDAHLLGDGRSRVVLEVDEIAPIRGVLRLAAEDEDVEALERRCAELEALARELDPVTVVDTGAASADAVLAEGDAEAIAASNVVAFPVIARAAFCDGREGGR